MRDLETDLTDYAFAEYGDFMVPNAQWEETAAEHSERSRRAQRADVAKRAPVTTNHQIWASDPGRWDYPGIDTPRAAPRVMPKDMMTSAYRRSPINVRTTDNPEYGGKAPLSPLGPDDLANELDRAEMISRGIDPANLEHHAGYYDERERHWERGRSDVEPQERVPDAFHGKEGRNRGDPEADPRDDITLHYEETPGLSDRISLRRYASRVRRKKREMGGLADDFAAAGLVNADLGLLEQD